MSFFVQIAKLSLSRVCAVDIKTHRPLTRRPEKGSAINPLSQIYPAACTSK